MRCTVFVKGTKIQEFIDDEYADCINAEDMCSDVIGNITVDGSSQEKLCMRCMSGDFIIAKK